jgi:peptide/nickel transport system substrate-binding protein
MKKKSLCIFAAYVLFFVAGCSVRKEGHMLQDNTLVLSSSGDPKSFNPIIAKETSTTSITGYIFEGLTQTDGVTLEVKPCLAREWKTDKTGKIWRFFLREDVKWHDGEDFTAKDVVFTFNRLVYNPEISTSSRDVLSIEGKPIRVTMVDRYTVEFELPERFAPFLRLMGHEILPEHKLAGKVDKGIFGSCWGVNEKPGNIVGTGPFILKEYRPAEWVVLDKNPVYWKVYEKSQEKLPFIERIVFFIIADTNMALLKFKTGEIDLISVRGQDYPLLKPFEKKNNFRIYELGPSLGSEFITFNQNPASPVAGYKKEWFQNRNFRKAVAYAIDKESIIRNVYGGFASPQDGPMNESCGFFNNPDITRYEYDIEKSMELLMQEGFYMKDNMLFDRQGNPVEFTILTNSNNFERIQIASIIQDDLKKTGMKINLLPVEFNTLVTRISVTKDWESVIIGLTGGIEPHNGKNVWHSGGQLHVWNQSSEIKTDWEKKVDRIFEEGAKLLDENRRKKLYDEWQRLVNSELPLIYTAGPMSMIAVRNKFGNLKPSVYGGALHNIEEIYIKQEETGK